MPRRVKSTDSPELKQQRAPQPIKAGKKKPEAEVKAESESDDETMLSDTDMSVNSEPEDAQSKIDAALKEDHSYMMHIDEAGNLKKGMVAVLKDKHVCKILENHQSKTGKHGHAKCAIVGLEIFTGKKVQEALPSSASVRVVDVEKTELRLVSIPTVDRHLEDVPGEPREALLRPLQEPAPSAAAIPPKPLAVTISDAAWEDLVDAYKESKHEKRGYDLTVTVTKAPKIKNDDDVTGVRRVTGFRKV